MNNIYTTIARMLKSELPELKHVDLDTGQLSRKEFNAAIDYPAAFISISFNNCEDMGHSGEQLCDTDIGIRVVSRTWFESNIAAPDNIRERALEHYKLLGRVHEKLQCWQPECIDCSILRRVNNRPEKRNDGLQVNNITYNLQYFDPGNAIPGNSKLDNVNPVITPGKPG